MATRIVSTAELQDRLDALDLAHPAYKPAETILAFGTFIDRLKIYKSTPRFIWFPGTAHLTHRLRDSGLSGGHWRNRFDSSAGNALETRLYKYRRDIATGEPDRRQPVLPSTLLTTWMRGIADRPSLFNDQTLLRDNNVLTAAEGGLGWWKAFTDRIILIPRPTILLRNEGRQTRELVLHSLRGPAVHFQNDPISDQYWVRGTRVPKFIVTNPELITRNHIREAGDHNIRQAMIDQYGLLKYSLERGFKPIDQDDRFGATLYARGGIRSHSYSGAPLTRRECVVELINSTPEPDGRHLHVARRVPQNMQTAHEAVAWTFGLTTETYNPTVQT